jgi:acetoin utilization deacetylase AcuC-like enzyme
VDALRNGLVRTILNEVDVESPERVKCIKKHLEKFPEEFPITTKHNDYGVDPILEIHEKGYLDYLQTIYEEWSLTLLSWLTSQGEGRGKSRSGRGT